MQLVMMTNNRFVKYDFICENLPYGGTNSVLLDQLFYTFLMIFMVETAHEETKTFTEDAYERQIL